MQWCCDGKSDDCVDLEGFAVLEVELKYRVKDSQQVRAILLAWGAQPRPVRKDIDHYFNAPDRDFAQTDEAVRIRRIGTANSLTYKGPKQNTRAKTRTEIELPLADGAEIAATAVHFLSGLGFRPVAAVMKTREVFDYTRNGFALEICLDDVGAIGTFVEIEIMTEPTTLSEAQAILDELARDLGLTDLERRSYLQLLLDPTARIGTNPPSGG
jgi:adenylate cyclase class 2